MEWDEKLEQIINQDFLINFISFLKKETGQERLKLFWEELYKCSVVWEKKYHINYRTYHLYGVANVFDMFWFIDEFVFDDIKDLNQYLYILFFLSHFEGKSIKEQIKFWENDNVNCDWREIYIGNDVWDEWWDGQWDGQISCITQISESQFFNEITEYIEESLKRFKIRNEKYKNDDYAKSIAWQYVEIQKYICYLKELEGEKKIIRINEFGHDVTVRYFIENRKKMFTIRVDEFL